VGICSRVGTAFAIYLGLVLLLVSSTFRRRDDVRSLCSDPSEATALPAGWSMVQFARKYGEAQAAGSIFV
jgi:hypothetical protein